MYSNNYYPDYLMHYGVKGMKWGVRRKYYNKDGSLNTSGKQKELKKTYKEERKAASTRDERKAAKQRYNKAINDTYNKKYDSINRAYDAYQLGKAGANRINDRMNSGQSYAKARTIEYGKTMAKSMALTYAMLATPAIANATVSSFKKYANNKAIQKANAGLARIGTFQYEKVAGNVYRTVMK